MYQCYFGVRLSQFTINSLLFPNSPRFNPNFSMASLPSRLASVEDLTTVTSTHLDMPGVSSTSAVAWPRVGIDSPVYVCNGITAANLKTPQASKVALFIKVQLAPVSTSKSTLCLLTANRAMYGAGTWLTLTILLAGKLLSLSLELIAFVSIFEIFSNPPSLFFFIHVLARRPLMPQKLQLLSLNGQLSTKWVVTRQQ